MLICVQRASSMKQVIIPVMNREDGSQASANCAANMSSDGLPEVLGQLEHISQQLDRHIINVNLKFLRYPAKDDWCWKMYAKTIFSICDDIGDRVCTASSWGRTINCRSWHAASLVSNDEQWLDLETALQDSGKDGLFFVAVVRTVKSCIRNNRRYQIGKCNIASFVG